MNQYRLIIAYDGTDYSGWQVQPDQSAVANILQNTFTHVFNTPIKIIGASRTDAGVHAVGQVAVVITDLAIDAEKMLKVWNDHLPADIMIRSLIPVDASFHPQRNVKQKTYWYHIFPNRPLPFIQRYGYHFKYPFDHVKLYKALQVFVGTHDFRSFCTGYEQESTIRTIDSIKVHHIKRFNVWRIEVKGPGFLRYMIRRIVGAALEVASRDYLSIDDLRAVLLEKNPAQTLPNAPAQGLMLYKIIYKEEEV